MNHTLKIPPGLPLLLCTKEGQNSMSMSGLLLPELPHHPKCLSTLPYPWTHWWYEGIHPVHQVWHLLGIQQHLHPRRGPVESCLHHSHGTVQAHCHVLWILHQQTGGLVSRYSRHHRHYRDSSSPSSPALQLYNTYLTLMLYLPASSQPWQITDLSRSWYLDPT